MAVAVVSGASGGVGAALVRALEAQGGFEEVVGLARSGRPGLRHHGRGERRRGGAGARRARRAAGRGRDRFPARRALPAREKPAAARSGAHAAFVRGECDGPGADDEALPAAVSARGAVRVRHALGARRQHRRQSSGRLAQLSRLQGGAQPVHAHGGGGAEAHAAGGDLRLPASGHGGHAHVGGVLEIGARRAPARGCRGRFAARDRWADPQQTGSFFDFKGEAVPW